MSAKIEPTAKAMSYLHEHLHDITQVVERFAPSKIEEFSMAVEARDGAALNTIMNFAWFRAPDSRDVYSISGFREMCNLLDATVPGLIGEDFGGDLA